MVWERATYLLRDARALMGMGIPARFTEAHIRGGVLQQCAQDMGEERAGYTMAFFVRQARGQWMGIVRLPDGRRRDFVIFADGSSKMQIRWWNLYRPVGE